MQESFQQAFGHIHFSSRKTRLLNICPYCNYVLGGAEEAEKEEARVIDLEKRVLNI
jgi:hypothetical protein